MIIHTDGILSFLSCIPIAPKNPPHRLITQHVKNCSILLVTTSTLKHLELESNQLSKTNQDQKEIVQNSAKERKIIERKAHPATPTQISIMDGVQQMIWTTQQLRRQSKTLKRIRLVNDGKCSFKIASFYGQYIL